MSNPCCASRGDAKRQAVITAAEQIFLEQGYAAASMDGIAAAAGVSKRTVYNHFPSKQDLFQAVVSRLYSGLAETQRNWLPLDRPPEEALAEFARTLLAHLRRPDVQGLYRLIVADLPRAPEMGTAFRAGKSAAFEMLEHYFTAQNQRGTLNVPNAWDAAALFLGVVKEAAYWPGLLGLPVTDDEHAIALGVATVLKMYAPTR